MTAPTTAQYMLRAYEMMSLAAVGDERDQEGTADGRGEDGTVR